MQGFCGTAEGWPCGYHNGGKPTRQCSSNAKSRRELQTLEYPGDAILGNLRKDISVAVPALVGTESNKQFESNPFCPLSGFHHLQLLFGDLIGMMISRRPNIRASRDKAPAPRQMTAAAITADKRAVAGV